MSVLHIDEVEFVRLFREKRIFEKSVKLVRHLGKTEKEVSR